MCPIGTTQLAFNPEIVWTNLSWGEIRRGWSTGDRWGQQPRDEGDGMMSRMIHIKNHKDALSNSRNQSSAINHPAVICYATLTATKERHHFDRPGGRTRFLSRSQAFVKKHILLVVRIETYTGYHRRLLRISSSSTFVNRRFLRSKYGVVLCIVPSLL